MSKPRALLVMDESSFRAHFDAERLDRLAGMVALGDPVRVGELDSPAAQRSLARADVLLTSWGAPRLTEERLAGADRLRAVIHCAGTVRTLVSDAVWRRGLRVSNAADINAIPVAEFTLAAIILAGKKAPFLAADRQAAATGWGHRNGYGDLSNYRRTIGVVGFSRIGRRVVRLLGLLDHAQCLVADPFADPDEVRRAGGVPADLPGLLRGSDVLTLHAPENAQTRGMIGAAELALLPDHATVINTARGSLIDPVALEAECRSGRLFAILDVTDPEPLPAAHPLRSLPNVMITPHIAGSLGTEILRLSDFALDELGRWLAAEPLRAEVTADLLTTHA
ncbi:hydroxyacid dehydrogenase [Catenuloplanes atrovinosus]|uniref:Phosphoglycerate dehydrogenase-like enzyme n=1 Tax=Catenuloplanes atrovinosus TaxID=137266 RepID=A0AAE3YMS0_9ACTN|nr:hydroxyacid dehydrogenase [Catenuloplanes atrovinosus]MDR7275028.1 phosphoglycerate dehydrogenase-like enzyme [Catenuloplanes atrovinosus]